jgi:hypothetical protein
MTTAATANLRLELGSDPALGLDDEALFAAAAALMREVWDSGLVEDVLPQEAEPAGAGAKSGEAIAFGALLIAVLPATVPALIGLLKDWALRNKGLTIKVVEKDRSVEVVGYDPARMSQADLNALIANLRGQLQRPDQPQ